MVGDLVIVVVGEDAQLTAITTRVVAPILLDSVLPEHQRRPLVSLLRLPQTTLLPGEHQHPEIRLLTSKSLPVGVESQLPPNLRLSTSGDWEVRVLVKPLPLRTMMSGEREVLSLQLLVLPRLRIMMNGEFQVKVRVRVLVRLLLMNGELAVAGTPGATPVEVDGDSKYFFFLFLPVFSLPLPRLKAVVEPLGVLKQP